MIDFDANDPFPLLSRSYSYSEAQAHSEVVDHWLGFDFQSIEHELSTQAQIAGQQLWIGLPIQALLTPYVELREILNHLNPRPGQTLVDLGAGYGRAGFILGRHYPEVSFIGYEWLTERVSEGSALLHRWFPDRNNLTLVRADLSSPLFTPASADFYFIYDYGTAQAVDKTLEDLKRIAAKRSLVVVGRGRLSRHLIEQNHPWLSQIIPAEHFNHYSIYRTHET